MTPEQKRLVQQTWHQVAPAAEIVSALFYDRLFALDPKLRALFDGVDLQRQREKLILALSSVVLRLDELEALVPQIEDLGRRHAELGVSNTHYETVGAALLATLKTGLGEAWTEEVRDAWTVAYGAIADVMRDAPCKHQSAATA